MDLSKDADLLVCCAYKEYLERRKSGQSKRQANTFKPDFLESTDKISSWSRDDYLYTVRELKHAGFVTTYLDGTFAVTDKLIVYMENHFKNGLSSVIDFISKFIP